MTALVAEAISTPEPIVVGGGTFLVFVVLLFLVTRLNKDR
jgi:hypothetical protein